MARVRKTVDHRLTHILWKGCLRVTPVTKVSDTAPGGSAVQPSSQPAFGGVVIAR